MSRSHRRPRRTAAVLTAAALLALSFGATALAGGDWNDGQVAWLSHEEGLSAAREQGKPICLIFFTEWCPHCTNYSGVFHDPRVVARSREFVMVRIDRDRHPELSERYAVDGQYIPRTYFLSPQGVLDPSLKAPRDRFQYFYDEHDPASLLAGMMRALAKLR